jgi:streptogramin lyase
MVRLTLAGLALALLLATGPANGSAQKGDGPNLIVTGYGAVWIGTGDGSVIRIDPRTYRIVQRIDVSFTSVRGLVPAYGALWVATGTGLLKRIDPATGRVRDVWTPDVCTSQAVAVAAGAIWVLDGFRKRLCRFDPARNRVIRRTWIDAPEPLTLWSDSSRLWLGTNTDPKPPLVEDHLEHVRLVALDPRTGAALGPTIDTAGWVGFSAGFGSLWASDPIADTLARVDPASGRTIALRPGVDSAIAPVAGFGALWLPGGVALRRLDPDSLATVAEVRMAADTVAIGSGGVWVLDTGDGSRGTVTKVDPRTNRVVGRPIQIVPQP